MELQLKTDFVRKTCGNCGVEFFIPQPLETECLRTGQSWTCPNGHKRSYATTEVERYQKLYEEEQGLRRQREDEIDHANRQVHELRTMVNNLLGSISRLQASQKKLRGKLIQIQKGHKP